jgi:small-conductance mechanosensitive channel
LTNNIYLLFKTPEKYRADIIIGVPLNIDIEDFKAHIIEKISGYDAISENPKPQIFSRGIKYGETQLKVSFWVKDFNSKDEYKLIITNDIRKYIKTGE